MKKKMTKNEILDKMIHNVKESLDIGEFCMCQDIPCEQCCEAFDLDEDGCLTIDNYHLKDLEYLIWNNERNDLRCIVWAQEVIEELEKYYDEE